MDMETQAQEPVVFTDDKRPWVDANQSTPTMLGVAARMMAVWGQDWHKAGRDVATYDCGHNAVADMADAITELLIAQDAHAREVEALKQRVQELEANSALLEGAVRLAYRKHHLGDDSIGWEELSDALQDTLCEVWGDKLFQVWLKANSMGDTDDGE